MNYGEVDVLIKVAPIVFIHLIKIQLNYALTFSAVVSENVQNGLARKNLQGRMTHFRFPLIRPRAKYAQRSKHSRRHSINSQQLQFLSVVD